MTQKNKNLLQQLIKPRFTILLSEWDKSFIKSLKLQQFDFTAKQIDTLTKINNKCVTRLTKKRKPIPVVVYSGYNTCKK
jgi:hypothetical protein